MKQLILLGILGLFSFKTHGVEKNLFDFTINSPRGTKMNMQKFKGKSVLIVNIATRCGYTGQLDDLENLYKKYNSKGFIVLGIPSNDFGGQTPEKGQEVVKFCKLNYGVTFPMTSKVPVTGKAKTNFINHIVKSSGGDEIGWNFEKFLFDKEGMLVQRFSSSDKPLGAKLEKVLKGILK
jgi:glutathione peroxidase-family protein